MSNQIRRRRWYQLLTQPGSHWIVVALALYVAACLLPAYQLGSYGVMRGWECLMVWPIPWWWANPSILLAIILLRFHLSRTATGFGVIAVGLAMHCELSSLYEDGNVPIGCILWVSSLQIITINSLWQAWLDRKERLECLSLAASQDPPASSSIP